MGECWAEEIQGQRQDGQSGAVWVAERSTVWLALRVSRARRLGDVLESRVHLKEGLAGSPGCGLCPGGSKEPLIDVHGECPASWKCLTPHCPVTNRKCQAG